MGWATKYHCFRKHPYCRWTNYSNSCRLPEPPPPKFQCYWCLQNMAANGRIKSNPWGLTWRHTTATLKFRGPGGIYRSCAWGLINLSIYCRFIMNIITPIKHTALLLSLLLFLLSLLVIWLLLALSLLLLPSGQGCRVTNSLGFV